MVILASLEAASTSALENICTAEFDAFKACYCLVVLTGSIHTLVGPVSLPILQQYVSTIPEGTAVATPSARKGNIWEYDLIGAKKAIPKKWL